MRDDRSVRLSRKAGTNRAFAVIFGTVGSIVTLGGISLAGLSLWLLPGGWAVAGGIVGGVGIVLGALGLWSSGRARGRADALQRSVLEARLLAAVGSRRQGLTVEEAAGALRMGGPVADAALTEMAKRGTLDMDVDSEGVIRYRVEGADEDEPSVEGRDRVGQDQDLDQ